MAGCVSRALGGLSPTTSVSDSLDPILRPIGGSLKETSQAEKKPLLPYSTVGQRAPAVMIFSICGCLKQSCIFYQLYLWSVPTICFLSMLSLFSLFHTYMVSSFLSGSVSVRLKEPYFLAIWYTDSSSCKILEFQPSSSHRISPNYYPILNFTESDSTL